MHATTISTVDTCSLSDVRCNCDQERKNNILVDDYPSSVIPSKAAAARTVFHAVKIRIATLWDRFQEHDQELKVAGERNAFVKVCPRFQIDCCGEECACEEIDEGEGRDYGGDAEDSISATVSFVLLIRA